MTADSIPVCQAADPSPRSPGFAVPAGATDCHFHVFGPADRFPYAPNRTYTPPDHPADAYRHLIDTLGVTRCVTIHPSVYGTDNAITEWLLREAAGWAGIEMRGIAVLGAGTDRSTLHRLDGLGVRGVRYNLLYKGGPPADEIRAMADRIVDLGWHIQFLVDVSTFDLSTYCDLPVEIVVDHMGHMDPSKGIEDPGFATLLDLLRRGRAWAKLSGAYRSTARRHPPYDDVVPIARALAETAPDRCVWGTDWPHPFVQIPMPNDGDLMDELAVWVPDAARRKAILVDNPARLYGF
ncbi:MAG: amidohydrolase family protein [Alphaproteobacteria bacterium]|nr:amidohydrolase family protein [Alphaproteobacteria bacterium]